MENLKQKISGTELNLKEILNWNNGGYAAQYYSLHM